MEKGKHLIQEEEKEELMPVVIDYQSNVSSPSPSTVLNATLEESRNSSQNNLIGCENMPSNDTAKLPSKLYGSSSSSRPGSTPEKENSIIKETNDADMGDFFFKSLDINKIVLLGSEQPHKAPTHNVFQTDGTLTQIMSNIITPTSKAEKITLGPQKVLKKESASETLEEIARHDAKRAKRILGNRLSALRSKDKKKLNISMLEHKMESLLFGSNVLSSHLNLMQREIKCLKDEKTKMKEHIKMNLQKIHMQDIVNDEIREEIQYLNMLRQGILHRGIMFNSMNGYVGHNIPAIGASLDTRQFPHILMQNPYQQKEIQQMNYGAKDYQFQYEQGQSSESQQMQQQRRLEDYYQGQDEDVLPQSQEPCTEDPNIKESGTDERSDKDIFMD